MVDILNLALPYFGLIFIGFACGKARGLPESGLAWMNFFLLYVSLPALLLRIMSETPFSELNNPPFLIATTLATVSAFLMAMVSGRFIGELSLRKATIARTKALTVASVVAIRNGGLFSSENGVSDMMRNSNAGKET